MASVSLIYCVIIVLVALLSTRQCLKFDDIVQGVIDNNENKFDDNLAVLEQKVFNETVEVQEWRMRVDAIERQMVEVRVDKLEVLSRRERALKDPRLAFFAGKPGSPGRPGIPGRPGHMGKRGQKGPKGVAGPPGIRGPIGPYGPPGWKGPPGFTGIEGPKGEKGEEGFKGNAGYIGDVGLVGYIGYEGQMGPPGIMGHVGFIGMIGWPGPRGEKGEDGIMGPPSYPGRPGVPGRVGVYGKPGPIGEIGITGPPGHNGFEGDKGETGMCGETGPWGAVGLPGPVYDPYAGLMAPMVGKLAGFHGDENCTDLVEGVSKCLSHGSKNIPNNIQYNSKSLPVFSQPPPGAHVMPAEQGHGKSQMPFGPHFMKSPIAYGPHVGKSQMALGPPMFESHVGKSQMALGTPVYGKQYAAAHGHHIDFYDEEDRDILNEQEFNEIVNKTSVEATDTNMINITMTEDLGTVDNEKSNSSVYNEGNVEQITVETNFNTTTESTSKSFEEDNGRKTTTEKAQFLLEDVKQTSGTDAGESETKEEEQIQDIELSD